MRPAAAGDKKPLNYHPVRIQQDGSVDRASLDGAVQALPAELGDGPSEIVVLIHGFNTTEAWGRGQYERITRSLLREASGTGLRLGVVGIHWPSYPGAAWKWVPQVVGYRAVAELGFRKALKNPYREKMILARKVGRSGLRATLFRLEEAFPKAQVHLLAHSLGSEIVLRALVPQARPDEKKVVIEQPDRTLQVALATLAGADLDEDVFASSQEPHAREALDRARLWWVTVPTSDIADAALELRRGAGRQDAVGNRGLTLYREDLDRLLQRRGLVLDDRLVPITHNIESYYSPERLHDAVGAMAFLRDPSLPAARASVPAALAPNGPSDALSEATRRVYARWREDPTASSFGVVRVTRREPERESRRPVPARMLSPKPA